MDFDDSTGKGVALISFVAGCSRPFDGNRDSSHRRGEVFPNTDSGYSSGPADQQVSVPPWPRREHAVRPERSLLTP